MSDLGNKEVMAKNIQDLMDKRGITRNQLADALDFKYTTMADWLRGKTYPRIDKIELMANYFGVSKSRLVENQEGKSDKKPVEITDNSNIFMFEGKPVSEEDMEIFKQILNRGK